MPKNPRKTGTFDDLEVSQPPDETITIQDYTPQLPPGVIQVADTIEELDGGAPITPEAYAPHVPSPLVLDGEIMFRENPAGVRYEGRIRVLEAFQYSGHVKEAPEWIDRNWVAFADWDPLRNIEAGPALRVPTHRGDTALARVGDYVVRQLVVLSHDMPADIQIEVWPRDQFERYFIPTSSQPPKRDFQDVAEDAA